MKNETLDSTTRTGPDEREKGWPLHVFMYHMTALPLYVYNREFFFLFLSPDHHFLVRVYVFGRMF